MKYLLLFVTVLLISGCQRGMIHVNNIRPAMVKVMDRHDQYIESGKGPDGTKLYPTESRVQLNTTKLLRKILDEASK